MVEEALVYVQGASLKTSATSLLEGLLTPRSPVMVIATIIIVEEL